MSDEDEIVESAAKSRLSRRNALKAGVAVGVGVAAWSGASITSLGGTPAYAVACTGAIPPIDLNSTANCRNLDQRDGCNYAYHELKSVILVAGYPAGSFNIDPNIDEGTCCNDGLSAFFNFPEDLTCSVDIDIYQTMPGCTAGGTPRWQISTEPGSSPVEIIFRCATVTDDVLNLGAVPGPGDKYRVIANCTTSGTGNPECFD